MTPADVACSSASTTGSTIRTRENDTESDNGICGLFAHLRESRCLCVAGESLEFSRRFGNGATSG
jgi:hypothetical protein